MVSGTTPAAMWAPDALEQRIFALVRDYAANNLPDGALAPGLSLRDDLGVESLSLVSLAVRLGDELGVDVSEEAMELGNLSTVGDLVALGRRLQQGAECRVPA